MLFATAVPTIEVRIKSKRREARARAHTYSHRNIAHVFTRQSSHARRPTDRNFVSHPPKEKKKKFTRKTPLRIDPIFHPNFHGDAAARLQPPRQHRLRRRCCLRRWRRHAISTRLPSAIPAVSSAVAEGWRRPERDAVQELHEKNGVDDAFTSVEETSDLFIRASHLRHRDAALHGDRLVGRRANDREEAGDRLGV